MRRLLAAGTALALGAGTLLSGTVLTASSASAATTAPILDLGNAQPLPSPFVYDEYALWGGQGTYYFTYPLTEDSAQGVVTGSRTTPVMTSPGPYISGDPLSTLAVDGGGANGERTPRMYAWTWGDGRTVGNWPAGYPTPWTDYIPIAAYDEGQTTGKVHFVPTPRVSSGLSNAYNYWSGGEVYQSTGELYLSSGE
ncbi:hypothetical protein FO489_22820, partial [Bacillus licheniformis]